MTQRTCLIDDCDGDVCARGLCRRCYRRLYASGDLASYPIQRIERTCSVEHCGRPCYGRGWCRMHYARWRRTGSTSLELSTDLRPYDLIPGERWRPVTDADGHYEVSDFGRVRSLSRVLIDRVGKSRRHVGRLLSPVTVTGYSGIPYLVVGLGMNGHTLVHRLVLTAFVGPPPEGTEGCHENGESLDNRLTNLYWGTHSQNMRDTVRHRTNQNTLKDRCPLNHKLVEPNLVAFFRRIGRRSCLACSRARACKQKALRSGRPFNFDAVANGKYIQIMGASLPQ